MASSQKKYNFSKKNIILFVICMSIIGTCFFVPSYLVRKNSFQLRSQSFNDGWNVIAHGILYEDVTLSTTRFATFNKDETLILSSVLPESDIEDATLEIYSVHSMVDVFVDGKHIYNYGEEYYNKGQMLGYGWNFVRLPADYQGKSISIILNVTEDNSFEGMPAINIVEGDKVLKNIIVNGSIYLAIGMFLSVIGAIGMVFSMVLFFRNYSSFKMFCIMLFSFLIGVYTLANSDLLCLFNIDMAQKCVIEYISLYTFEIPFTVYFYDWLSEKDFPKRVKLLYNVWILVEILFAAVVIALHALNIVHLPWFVPVCHAVMIFTLVNIMIITIARFIKTKRIEKGITIGFSFAVAVAVFELFRYNIAKFGVGFKENKYNSTMGIAALIVVVTFFVDFMSKITNNLYREAQALAFEKMAYMDELTGLLNRRGIEEPINSLKTGKINYSIVSIDMNLLKLMNDTYGHATGDRALVLLSKKLSESFPEPCKVARVGGDEFVVIIPRQSEAWVRKHTDSFIEKMYEYNLKGGNVTLSAAVGTAFSTEAETLEEVLALADERMYEKKKESKMGRDDA